MKLRRFVLISLMALLLVLPLALPSAPTSAQSCPVSTLVDTDFTLGDQGGWTLNQSPDWYYPTSIMQGYWAGDGWQTAKNSTDNGWNVETMYDLGDNFVVTQVFPYSAGGVLNGANWIYALRTSPTGSNVYTHAVQTYVNPNVTARYVAVGLSRNTTASAKIVRIRISGYLESCDGPTAAFTYSPSSGDAPLTVDFTDTSNGNGHTITAWSWNFNRRIFSLSKP